jgi:hypothetical protein
MWTKISDDDINHNWQCGICLAEANVAPGWYEQNGTPVCIECDQDMEYQYTEIKNNG